MVFPSVGFGAAGLIVDARLKALLAFFFSSVLKVLLSCMIGLHEIGILKYIQYWLIPAILLAQSACGDGN